MVPRRRQSTRDGEDNQECVDRSIDRSIVPRFRASFSRRLDLLHSLLVVVGVLFVPEETKRARHAYSSTRVSISISRRAIASRRFVFLYSLTSRRFLSLSLEQHSMLHRRRVRRGPDHGHDRAEVPAHRGKQRASLIKVVFARFITTSSICSRLQNARVQNVRVRHTTGPRRRHFFDARDAIAEEKRSRRTVGRVVGGLLSPFFVGSGVLTLSLSLSRECNTNPLSSLKCTNLFFLLRTKRSPWSI